MTTSYQRSSTASRLWRRSCASLFGVVILAGAMGCAPEPLAGERDSVLQVERSSTDNADSSAAPAVPLITVDGRHITLVELERRLAQLSPIARQLFDTPTTRTEFLEFLLWIELLSNEATRLGWTDSELAAVLVDDARARELLRQRAAEALDGQQVPDDAVAERWAESADEWLPLRRRRVAALRVATLEEAQTIADAFTAQMAADPERSAMTAFTTHARIHSTHESRAEQGKLGWVVHPDSGGVFSAAMAAYLFSAPTAQLLSPYPATDGVWLFYVAAEQELVRPTLDDVSSRVRERLNSEMLAQAQRSEVDGARSAVAVAVNDTLVGELSALRGEQPEIRPRRFDAMTLAGAPEAALGNDWNSLAQGILDEYRVNEVVAAIVPAPPIEVPEEAVETP
jgi:hypothetical protein